MTAGMGGGGSVTVAGSGSFRMNGAPGYSGSTIVSNGTLIVNGSKSGGAGLSVQPGGTLAGHGSIGEAVTVTNGTLSAGESFPSEQTTLTLGANLTISNATSVFELVDDPAGANDLIAVSGNLVVAGTNVLQIVPVRPLGVKSNYTLFTYTGPTLPSSATNQFTIAVALPGHFLTMLDPQTTPGKVVVTVVAAPSLDLWLGNLSAAWDTTTINWLQQPTGNAIAFKNGDYATFGDTTTARTNISLSTTLYPFDVGFTNSIKPYFLVGPGKLSGSNGFHVENIDNVYIQNAGSNDFTGPISINQEIGLSPGTVVVGDGGVNGNLPATNTVTTYGHLAFNHSDDIIVSNTFVGGLPSTPFVNSEFGAISNIGTGTLTLAGNSPNFTGWVAAVKGTVRVANNNALGVATNGTIVFPGATLDVGNPFAAGNTVNLSTEPILVSGWGVSSNGAIINSTTNLQINALQKVILTGDTAIGGPGVYAPNANDADKFGRWDIRGSPANCYLSNFQGAPFNLFKIGSNQVSLVGCVVDPNLQNIYIQNGCLGFETTTTTMGDPNALCVVSNTATLDFFSSTNLMNKHFVFYGNGVSTNLFSASGSSTMVGPVSLNGDVVWTIIGTSFTNMGSISGPGGLTKAGSGADLILMGTNAALGGLSSVTYAGFTKVTSGSLILLGDVGISNSPVINLVSNGAIIDVLSRTNSAGNPDPTLTLLSFSPTNQTLIGIGTVLGSLYEDALANIAPAGTNATGTLTVSSNLTLVGNTFMELDKLANTNFVLSALGNDQLRATNIAYGGSLFVSFVNSQITNHLANGDVFQLFSTTNPITGSFGSITYSPVIPSPGFAWDSSKLSVDGTIRVVSTNATTPHPGISSGVALGNNITFSGTNGIVNGQYYLLASTNVIAGLTNWSRIGTNYFDATGKFSFTVTVNPSQPQRFFTVQVP